MTNLHSFLLLPIMLLTLTTNLFAQNTIVLQAEDATYNGKTDTKHTGYTGSGFVDTENEVGAYIEFEFSIKDAGETDITVFYAHGKTDDRSASVTLNDSMIVSSLAFPATGAFTTWSSVQFKAGLRRGTNLLRLTALASEGLVNIDKIEIAGEIGATQYKLTLQVSGRGSVSVVPDEDYYDAGSVVTLTAINTDQAVFDHWEGALSGNNLTMELTVNSNETVKACFNKTAFQKVYCSPAGDDATADGTIEKPYYSLQLAVNAVTSGDTIIMKNGIYNYSSRININNGGDEDNYITLMAEGDGRAVLDFAAMADEDANQGIRLTGSYWHFYKIDITNAGDNGLLIERNKPSGGSYSDVLSLTEEAHHNIIEFCNFYRNRDSGLQLKNLAENNRIINCDSYYNRDSSDGDADGFAPKMTLGTGNYFYGCRAWNNSDDGWDLYLKCEDDGFPQDMVTTIENCWCWKNGFLEDGTESEGNGNGFKLGGSSDKDERHDALLIRCLSFDNLQKGFDQNNNKGNMTLVNCTGFATPYTSNSSHYTYRIDGTELAAGKKLVEINNVAVCDGLDRKKSKWAPCEMIGGEVTTCNYLASDEEFISVSTIGVDGERASDGSLPCIDFMKLKNGSSLIDAGTIDERVDYSGLSPDMGCFESEYTGVNRNTATLDNAINVYPVPCDNLSSIEFYNEIEGTISATLFTSTGTYYRHLFSKKADRGIYSFDISFSNIPSGVYVLQITTAKGVLSTKIIRR